jgi:hypothetical protein
MGVIAAGAQVQQVSGQVVMKADGANLGLTATDTPGKKTVNLGLSLSFDKGAFSPLKVGVGAVVTDGKVTGGTLDASLKTSVGEFGLKGQETGKQFQGLATWTVPF